MLTAFPGESADAGPGPSRSAGAASSVLRVRREALRPGVSERVGRNQGTLFAGVKGCAFVHGGPVLAFSLPSDASLNLQGDCRRLWPAIGGPFVVRC